MGGERGEGEELLQEEYPETLWCPGAVTAADVAWAARQYGGGGGRGVGDAAYWHRLNDEDLSLMRALGFATGKGVALIWLELLEALATKVDSCITAEDAQRLRQLGIRDRGIWMSWLWRQWGGVLELAARVETLNWMTMPEEVTVGTAVVMGRGIGTTSWVDRRRYGVLSNGVLFCTPGEKLISARAFVFYHAGALEARTVEHATT